VSSFFDDLEDQLRTAAQARTSARAAGSRPPRRRRAWLRNVPVLAAVSFTLAIAVAALVLLGHGRTPTPTPPAARPPGGGLASILGGKPSKRTQRELAYITAADRQVQDSRACRPRLPAESPVINRPPGRALLSTIGVLRRPATAADLPKTPIGGLGTRVYAGYTRRTLVVDGTSYYVVAARDQPSFGIPSARCLALETAALERSLPRIPAALRAPTRELQARLAAYDRGLAERKPVDSICVAKVRRNGGGTDCGLTVAAIKHGVPVSNDQGTYSGVVPDGVASVTLRVPASAGRPAHDVTTAVVNNTFAVHVAGARSTALPSRVIWRSASGRTIKTISDPSPQGLAKYCAAHPTACAPGSSASSSSSSATTPKLAHPPAVTTIRARPVQAGGGGG
jgi:hypothetical protein